MKIRIFFGFSSQNTWNNGLLTVKTCQRPRLSEPEDSDSIQLSFSRMSWRERRNERWPKSIFDYRPKLNFWGVTTVGSEPRGNLPFLTLTDLIYVGMVYGVWHRCWLSLYSERQWREKGVNHERIKKLGLLTTGQPCRPCQLIFG